MHRAIDQCTSMSLFRRLIGSRAFQKALGVTAAEYLRFVWNTSRVTIDPPDIYERVAPDMPVIIAMWHGQHLLMPFAKRKEHRAKVLISRHRDGEVNAIAAERLGVGAIRGSGAHDGEFTRKGGVSAFLEMLHALKDGYSLALTADVPKVSRVAGLGIVMLARASGRPILPVAVVTSRRIEFNNWDRTTIGLPFGRGAIVAGDLIRVPKVDEKALEAYRKIVEEGVNQVTQRAHDIVDPPNPKRAA
jgi:lysophospholipid acyltransferase (LPLAT)-like uncharacterized protein